MTVSTVIEFANEEYGAAEDARHLALTNGCFFIKLHTQNTNSFPTYKVVGDRNDVLTLLEKWGYIASAHSVEDHPLSEKDLLRLKSATIWFRACRRGRVRPDDDQCSTLVHAYHMSVLPWDKNYNLYQWVEDGFPEIG